MTKLSLPAFCLPACFRVHGSMLGLGLLSSLFLLGCAGNDPSANRPDTLIYARGGDSTTLDPGSMEEGFSVMVATQIFEGLVQFKNGALEVEPALATEWQTSEDGRTWTFTLREGVTFHDGTPFTADDVVFSIMRMIDEDHPYHLPGRMPYADYALNGVIESVEKIDEDTVAVHLYEPFAPLLKTLAMFCCFISSQEAIETHGEDYGANPVGTGPYRFVSWQRDVEIALQRFDGYWGEPAGVTNMVYKTIRDPDVRMFGLIRGEIDMMDGLTPQIANELKNRPEVKLYREPGTNISIAYINVKEEPFTDKRIRQAVNYAVDKEAICDYLYEGYAVPMRGIYPEGVLGHDPDAEGYPYNPEKAKQLMAEAGYADGFECELLTYSVPRPYNPLGTRLAEAIQSDLGEVGIDVTVTQLEWGTHLKRTLDHDFQLALLGWITDNGDPDNFAYALLANPQNRAQYDNPEFIRLVQQGQQTYDQDERLQYYRRAQEIVLEDAPWLLISHYEDLFATRARVENFELHPMGSHYMWPLTLPTAAE